MQPGRRRARSRTATGWITTVSTACILGAAAAAAEDAACASPDAWRDASSWQQLRRGLSRAEVVRILGDPGRTVIYAGFERWEYPDLRGGRVNFDDRGLAIGWRPPPRRPAQ